MCYTEHVESFGSLGSMKCCSEKKVLRIMTATPNTTQAKCGSFFMERVGPEASFR